MTSVLSLFAGIGGLDLGLEAVGYKTRWYSEVDPYASRVMATRFPTATNLGDISEIDWSKQERPMIICGGFPCQDISLAGKGAGIDGERSGLWSCYADAIRTLRPRGVLVENVAALLHRGIDRVLGDLAACGYDAEWDCVPAAAVGAPHLRDRIFVVAYRADIDQNDGGKAASNTVSIRLQGPWECPQPVDTATDAYREATDVVDAFRRSNLPFVCGRHDGFSFGMERLRCLGNAVVPQVAEHVAAILHTRLTER